jgi:hypothetical protein
MRYLNIHLFNELRVFLNKFKTEVCAFTHEGFYEASISQSVLRNIPRKTKENSPNEIIRKSSFLCIGFLTLTIKINKPNTAKPSPTNGMTFCSVIP